MDTLAICTLPRRGLARSSMGGRRLPAISFRSMALRAGADLRRVGAGLPVIYFLRTCFMQPRPRARPRSAAL